MERCMSGYGTNVSNRMFHVRDPIIAAFEINKLLFGNCTEGRSL